MPYMYSEMQNKLSKTRESPLESMGQIISSQCPYPVCVRGSDYSTAIVLSEDKDIYSNCNATLQK